MTSGQPGPHIRSIATSSAQVNLGGASRTSQQSSENAPEEPQESDIVRIAVDLRYASNLISFWADSNGQDGLEDDELAEH